MVILNIEELGFAFVTAQSTALDILPDLSAWIWLR